MESKASEMTAYVKASKLGFDKKNDLQKIVLYYNSLFKNS